jgi:hypothetical protein
MCRCWVRGYREEELVEVGRPAAVPTLTLLAHEHLEVQGRGRRAPKARGLVLPQSLAVPGDRRAGADAAEQQARGVVPCLQPLAVDRHDHVLGAHPRAVGGPTLVHLGREEDALALSLQPLAHAWPQHEPQAAEGPAAVRLRVKVRAAHRAHRRAV